MKRILLIGAGVATTSLLKHLMSQGQVRGLSIDIIDEKDNLGRGRAYIEDSERLLANVPITEMALDDDPNHFKAWLQKQGYKIERFSTRRQFGDYMQSILDDIVESDSTITTIYKKLVQLDYDGNVYTANIDGKLKQYDIVFLGIGMLEYIDPYRLKGTPNFIYNPYPVQETLQQVSGNVAIVGSGLSGIDCLRYLLMESKFEKVYMFNRSNSMPAVRGNTHQFEFKYFTEKCLMNEMVEGIIPLERVKALFIKEARHQNIELDLFERKSGHIVKDLTFDIEHPDAIGKLEYFLIEFNKVFTPFLHLLNVSEQETFMKEYQPYISENYSPMPKPVAEKIIEWLQSGSLEMIENLEDVERQEKFILTADGKTYEMDIVINATGPNRDIKTTTDLLINYLYMNDLITPHHLGGFTVDANHNIISPRHGVLKSFYALGELTFGMTYLSNAVFDIYEMSRKIANEIREEISQ